MRPLRNSRLLRYVIALGMIGILPPGLARSAEPARPADARPADEVSPSIRVTRDIEYARVGDHRLLLDLHLPTTTDDAKPPLIVWVHGGAWRSGSKQSMPLGPLVAKGWAVASVDYRLSTQARFPAQVHDIKAAVRYLRASRAAHGYAADRVVIAGNSAGGHLAMLVGVTHGHPALEGDVGGHRGQSSDVQAIVSFYGMSNLTTILAQSTPHGLRVRVPALDLLLGGQPADQPELAGLASPVFHVDGSDPPLLLLHGDQDNQAPVNQSLEMQGKYERHKLPAELVIVHGGGHGGGAFYAAGPMGRIESFLARHGWPAKER